jgi:hypothetical protein
MHKLLVLGVCLLSTIAVAAETLTRSQIEAKYGKDVADRIEKETFPYRAPGPERSALTNDITSRCVTQFAEDAKKYNTLKEFQHDRPAIVSHCKCVAEQIADFAVVNSTEAENRRRADNAGISCGYLLPR